MFDLLSAMCDIRYILEQYTQPSSYFLNGQCKDGIGRYASSSVVCIAAR